jgi:hypothetical protein
MKLTSRTPSTAPRKRLPRQPNRSAPAEAADPDVARILTAFGLTPDGWRINAAGARVLPEEVAWMKEARGADERSPDMERIIADTRRALTGLARWFACRPAKQPTCHPCLSHDCSRAGCANRDSQVVAGVGCGPPRRSLTADGEA